MKRLAWILALGAIAHGGEGIEWGQSLDAAEKQSARDGRPVVLYFTFDT